MPTPDTDSAEKDAPDEGMSAAAPETVSAVTTPLGKAIESMGDAIIGLAASAGIGLTPDQMAAIARARDNAEEAGKTIAALQGGLSSARSFDRDGDGKPGGSLPRGKASK